MQKEINMNSIKSNFDWNIEEYFEILFSANALVCHTSDLYSTVVSLRARLAKPEFIAINELKDCRKDSNVTCYRNFLIEIDGMPLADQRALMETIPYSTLVYSGGKSLHAVISLQEPLKTKAEYDKLAKRILAKVPQADAANKNPSRFTRAPGARRSDTGNVQKLLDYTYRRPLDELETWLGPEVLKEKVEPLMVNEGKISEFTRDFFGIGAPNGERNKRLFIAACDCARNNWPMEKTVAHATTVLDLSEGEIMRTVQSAYKTVGGS